MKLKTLNQKEFEYFLMNWKISKYDKLPYLENYISYQEGNLRQCDMYGFLFFLRYEVKRYRSAIGNDNFTFKDYLNTRYPPERKVDEGLENLDNHLRENYLAEDTIKIEDLLDLIEEFE